MPQSNWHEPNWPEPNWPGRRWVWGLWSGLPGIVSIPAQAFLHGKEVVRESGMLEGVQSGLWILSFFSAIIVSMRLTDRRCRATTVLLGVIALAALVREFDLHTLFNPATFGEWGVRFRADWWFDSAVPLTVKALWVIVAVCLTVPLIRLALASRGPMDWRRARPRLVTLAVFMMFVGFACDDLFRGTIDLFISRLIEESAELIAASAFLAAVLGPESASPDFLVRSKPTAA